jgi:hypothetical protein
MFAWLEKIMSLETEVKKVEGEVVSEVKKIEGDVKADFVKFEGSVSAEIVKLKTDVANLNVGGRISALEAKVEALVKKLGAEL